jgi:hypothetical protein
MVVRANGCVCSGIKLCPNDSFSAGGLNTFGCAFRKRSEIVAEHPLADGPWIFSRTTLESAAAKTLISRVQRNLRTRKTCFAEDQHKLFNNIPR